MRVPRGASAAGREGVQGGDVFGGAALPEPGSAGIGEAEIAAEVLGDLGDRAVGEVFVELRVIEAFAEFGAEAVGLFGALGDAGDFVLHVADYLPAQEGAWWAGLGGGPDGCVEVLGEEDGAPDAAGDAVERDGGVWRGLGWFGRFLRRGRGLLGGLAVDVAREVGAEFEEFVEDGAVVVGVWLLRRGWCGGLGSGGHLGRIRNIFFGVCQVWRGVEAICGGWGARELAARGLRWEGYLPGLGTAVIDKFCHVGGRRGA